MKILFLLLLTSSSLLAQKAPTISQLVGTWKLVSVEDTMQDATLQPSKPFGPHPHGFIMYGPDGYMCATIVNGDRAPWTDPAKPTEAEKAAYYDTRAQLLPIIPRSPGLRPMSAQPPPRPFKLEGDQFIITLTKGISDPSIKTARPGVATSEVSGGSQPAAKQFQVFKFRVSSSTGDWPPAGCPTLQGPRRAPPPSRSNCFFIPFLSRSLPPSEKPLTYA